MATVSGVGVWIDIDDSSDDMTRLVIRGDIDASNVGALHIGLDLACCRLPAVVVVDVSSVGWLSVCAVRALGSAAGLLAPYGTLRVEGAPRPIRLALAMSGYSYLMWPSTRPEKQVERLVRELSLA